MNNTKKHNKHFFDDSKNILKKIALFLNEKSKIILLYTSILLYILIIFYLTPKEKTTFVLKYKKDDIAKEDIIAKIDFPILKDSIELKKEIQLAASQIYPVFNKNDNLINSKVKEIQNILNNIRNFSIAQIKEKYDLTISEYIQNQLKNRKIYNKLLNDFTNIFKNVYKIGVCRNKDEVQKIATNGIITLKSTKEENQILASSLYDEESVINIILNKTKWFIANNEEKKKFIYDLSLYLFEPNIVYNETLTNILKEQAKNSINITKGYIKKGEKIVGKYERITPEIYQKLKSQEIALKKNQHNQSNFRKFFQPNFAKFFFIIFTILIFFTVIFFYDKKYIFEFKYINLIQIITILPLIIFNIISRSNSELQLLNPITLAVILVCILTNHNIGFISAFYLAVLLGIYDNYDFSTFYIALFVLIIANYSVLNIKKRKDFYKSLLILPVAYTIILLIIYFNTLSPTQSLYTEFLYGIIAGFIAPVLAIGLLPIFESIYGITTDLTLLELSDLNHPLLQELAVKAPGTYSHSLTVGTLAKEAANAIGANPLLARVGAYFHDIGKIEKPEYFIENQHGENKHDNLNPNMSALILTNHVKEGLELAKKYKLPKEIMEIISQHHGTSLIKYFYDKAIKSSENTQHIISEESFRYPGPKPKSKEAGIVMLADSIEAVSRTLKNPTSSRIKSTIEEIIKDKFLSGELDESNLTLRELNSIAEAFLKILSGMHHQRIEYPDQIKNNNNNNNTLEKNAQSKSEKND